MKASRRIPQLVERARRSRRPRLAGRQTSAIRSPSSPAPSTTRRWRHRLRLVERNGKPGNDQGDTRVDEATLRRIHLPGYITAINAGVGTIMPSYSSWNGVKVFRPTSTCSPKFSRTNSASRASSSPTTTPSTRSIPITKRPSASPSTPAWTWSWCPSRYKEYITDLKATGQRRHGPHVPHRRRRHPHPARQVRHGH